MPLKHKKVSGVADGADATLVRPSDWNDDHEVSGSLDFPLVATPAVPAADNVRVFGRKVAGRSMLAMLGPLGLNTALQPFIARNKVAYWTPIGNVATVPLAFGIAAPTATGTATLRNVAITNLFTSMKRLGYVSAATANAVSGARSNALQFWRGNAAGLGGFTNIWRFGVSDAVLVAGRTFVGMIGSAGAPTDVQPSALLNCVGICQQAGDVNFSIVHNDGTGTGTLVPLGSDFPCNTTNTDAYELALFAAPNGSSIGWRVERLGTAFVAEGTITTDMPAATQLLTPSMWRSNAGNLLAVGLDLVTMYLETDY